MKHIITIIMLLITAASASAQIDTAAQKGSLTMQAKDAFYLYSLKKNALLSSEEEYDLLFSGIEAKFANMTGTQTATIDSIKMGVIANLSYILRRQPINRVAFHYQRINTAFKNPLNVPASVKAWIVARIEKMDAADLALENEMEASGERRSKKQY